MTAPGYIYVTDQGRVFASRDDPTDEDLAYAQVGMVTIIRLADYHFYGTAHAWTSIAPGQLGRAAVEGVLTRPFHAATSEFEPAALKSEEAGELFEEKISTPPYGGSDPADARRRRFTPS